MKVCDKICIFFFFPIINKYFLMAKRSSLSRCPLYMYWMASILWTFIKIKRAESCAYFKKKAYVLYSICLYVAAGIVQSV